jgi:hypothetical protein
MSNFLSLSPILPVFLTPRERILVVIDTELEYYRLHNYRALKLQCFRVHSQFESQFSTSLVESRKRRVLWKRMKTNGLGVRAYSLQRKTQATSWIKERSRRAIPRTLKDFV